MPRYDPHKGTGREELRYYLAARHWQPGPEFAEDGAFDSMLGAATRIQPDLAAGARRLGEEFAAGGAVNLLLDYTCLLLGPTLIIAKPSGSVCWSGTRRLRSPPVTGPRLGESHRNLLSRFAITYLPA